MHAWVLLARELCSRTPPDVLTLTLALTHTHTHTLTLTLTLR